MRNGSNYICTKYYLCVLKCRRQYVRVTPGPPQVRSHSHDSRLRSRPPRQSSQVGVAQRRPFSLRWQRAQARTAAQGRCTRRRCCRGSRRRPRHSNSHPRRVVRMRGLSGRVRVCCSGVYTATVYPLPVHMAPCGVSTSHLPHLASTLAPPRPPHARGREETHSRHLRRSGLIWRRRCSQNCEPSLSPPCLQVRHCFYIFCGVTRVKDRPVDHPER